MARRRRRAARHYRALACAGAEPAAGSHETRVVASVSAERVRPQPARALTVLTPGERDVLLLVALSRLNHEEVAEALDISYGTVGSRLSHARKTRYSTRRISMDDPQLIGTLPAKPGPSADVIGGGRERLRAVAAGTTRKRRLTWRVTVPVAAAAVVAFADGSPTATPNGPPAATVSGRRILLSAAVSAETRPAGAGTYCHVRTVYADHRSTHSIESWTRRDGREYVRNGSGRPPHRRGGVRTGRRAADLSGAADRPGGVEGEAHRHDRLRYGQAPRPHRRRRRGSPAHRVADRSAGPVPAPPKVRAAAFRAIASLPGVSRAGSAPGGQTPLIHRAAGDLRTVGDPATSLVRGWTATPPSPLPGPGAWPADQSVSVPVAGWTSEPPA